MTTRENFPLPTDFTPPPNPTPGRIEPAPTEEWRKIGLLLQLRREEMIARGHFRFPVDDRGSRTAATAADASDALRRGPRGMAVRSTVVALPDDPVDAVWRRPFGGAPPRVWPISAIRIAPPLRGEWRQGSLFGEFAEKGEVPGNSPAPAGNAAEDMGGAPDVPPLSPGELTQGLEASANALDAPWNEYEDGTTGRVAEAPEAPEAPEAIRGAAPPRVAKIKSWLRCAFFGATAAAALALSAGWLPWAPWKPSSASTAAVHGLAARPDKDAHDANPSADAWSARHPSAQSSAQSSAESQGTAWPPEADEARFAPTDVRDAISDAPRTLSEVPVRRGSRRPTAVLPRAAAPPSGPAFGEFSPAAARAAMAFAPGRGELALLRLAPASPTPEAADAPAAVPARMNIRDGLDDAPGAFSAMAAPRRMEAANAPEAVSASAQGGDGGREDAAQALSAMAAPFRADGESSRPPMASVTTDLPFGTAESAARDEEGAGVPDQKTAETLGGETEDGMAPDKPDVDGSRPIPGAWLMIHADRKTLGLCVGREYVKVYRNIGAPRDLSRDKLAADDGRTPSGRYFVGLHMDDDAGPRLILSWPAPADARRALTAGAVSESEAAAIETSRKRKEMPPQDTSLGGGLSIVGHGDEPQPTEGGFALSDADVRELIRVLPENAWVVIE